MKVGQGPSTGTTPLTDTTPTTSTDTNRKATKTSGNPLATLGSLFKNLAQGIAKPVKAAGRLVSGILNSLAKPTATAAKTGAVVIHNVPVFSDAAKSKRDEWIRVDDEMIQGLDAGIQSRDKEVVKQLLPRLTGRLEALGTEDCPLPDSDAESKKLAEAIGRGSQYIT